MTNDKYCNLGHLDFFYSQKCIYKLRNGEKKLIELV